MNRANKVDLPPLRVFAVVDRHKRATESPVNLVCHTQIELDAVGKAQRKIMGEFMERLARIIEKNETLPELEKMERSEFVVDVAGRYLAVERRRNKEIF